MSRPEERLTEVAAYRRASPGAQPEYLFPAYASTVKRAPTRPLVLLPHTLSEVTGPLFGPSELGPDDNDLTRHHPGEPIGRAVHAVRAGGASSSSATRTSACAACGARSASPGG